jgi:hypothetical protein
MNTQTPTQVNAAKLLYNFAHQKPRLEPCNYGYGREGFLCYRRESAEITRDLHDFRELFALASLLVDNLEEKVKAKLENNSGRLSLKDDKIEYITGQYFPTEYRPAASRILVSLIWEYFRNIYTTGDEIRKAIKRQNLSRRVIKNYFR